MSLHCKACQHEWNGQVGPSLRKPISVVVAHMRAMVCPQCGAGMDSLSIQFGASHRADLPEQVFDTSTREWRDA